VLRTDIPDVRRQPKLVRATDSKELLVTAVGIELLIVLKTRKLLMLRNGKTEKNHRNAEPRYTRGARNNPIEVFDFLKRNPADCSRNSTLSNRLALSCRSHHGFA